MDTVYRRKKLSILIQRKTLSALQWYAQNYSTLNRIDFTYVLKKENLLDTPFFLEGHDILLTPSWGH